MRAANDPQCSEWGWRVQSNPPEVTPLSDLRDHIAGMSCWCKPFMDEEVIVHNALDGREKIENPFRDPPEGEEGENEWIDA